MDWFKKCIESLPTEPTNPMWARNNEILCESEDVADKLADCLEVLYSLYDVEELFATGYYDPVEDERIGETDIYTGWWYVDKI